MIMTREDTKKAIEVMKAYVDGKEIELNDHGTWIKIEPEWSWGGRLDIYRIKPEPKYRPYANAEEMDKAIQEHGSFIKHQTTEIRQQIVSYVDDVYNSDKNSQGYTYEHLFKSYTWLDGTPCGVVEE